MDQQLKQVLDSLSKTRGVEDIEMSLPLEQTNLANINWNQNWRMQLEKYLKNALMRCDSLSRRGAVNILTERINYELEKNGEKKIKL